MGRLLDSLKKNRSAVILTSLLVSAVIITVLISQLGNIRSDLRFSRAIRRSDVLIDEQNYSEAQNLLANTIDSANSPRDFLMLLARASEIGLLLGDFSLFDRASEIGFSSYPGNENLRAVAVQRYIEAGMLVQAASAAKALESRQYVSLKVEALLLAGIPLEGENLDGVLQGIALPLSPQAMADPQRMYEAGLLTGDSRYFVNAAVLYAALGEIQTAYDLLNARKDMLQGTADALVLLRLAYDASEFQASPQVGSLLPPDMGYGSQSLSILADMNYFAGNAMRSFELHRLSVLRNPGNSFNSYHNLMVLVSALALPDTGEVSDVYAGAARYHGADAELAGRAVVSSSSNIDQLSRFDFSQALSRYPESDRLLLISMLSDYMNSLAGPGQAADIIDITLALEQALNRSPGDKQTRNLLLYAFALQDDRQGLETILGRYADSKDPVLKLYAGYLDMLYGNVFAAREKFEIASEAQIYEASFNIALIELNQRYPVRALSYLHRAEADLQEISGDLAKITDNIYHQRYLDIQAYIALAAALSDRLEEANTAVANIRQSGSNHILLPRILEMIDAL